MKQLSIITLICLLSLSSIAQTPNNAFALNPYKVLSSWTYEDVIKQYGEGINIIDTMSGQAYIAGFKYENQWLDRPCEMEFYFTDVDVSRFQLRFIHPNNYRMEEMNNQLKKNAKSGIIESNVVPDSIWIKRLKENPNLLDSLGNEWKREFIHRKELLEQDSLRGDSIIKDFAMVLGEPLRQGPTPHTDKDSRYFATWIKNGYSCSVKDYRQFTEAHFGISPAPGSVIAEFNIDPGTQLIEKFNLQIRNEAVEISLLGRPSTERNSYYSQIDLLAKAKNGNLYLDELPEERESGFNPRIELKDLTGDGIPEVWLKIDTDINGSCTNNYIYTMELIEPLLIFDPLEDFELELEGEFQDNYQAMVVIDGYPRTYLPLEKNDAIYQGIYDDKGKLLKQHTLSAGCLTHIKSMPYKSKKGSQFLGYMPLYGVSEKNIIGKVQAIWDYNTGGWELRSLEISQD